MVSVEVNTYGSVTVLSVNGKFFTDSISYVNEIWKTVIDKKPCTIAINCIELSSIDSAAVGTLVGFLNYAMEQNIELVFIDLCKDIRRLFDTAKLNDFFTITSTQKFCRKYQISISA